jgi:drug/metabolite transporter (DMT)-like permease
VTDDTLATLAQVYPVLLLALAWDSGFLERLSRQRRLTRRHDPQGVLFWTKRRVRWYTIAVFNLLILDIGIAVLTLADVVPRTPLTVPLLLAGLLLSLGTLMTRVTVDVLEATRTEPKGGLDRSDRADDCRYRLARGPGVRQ